MNPSKLNVGTSGWHYDHWQGPFYPEGLASSEWLPYYAERLSTVEINNSFYQLPAAKTLRAWRDATPDEFSFAVKASRYITHMKKLKDPDEPVASFLERMEALGTKLGPVLFQLPPNWRFNPDRLRSFLDSLPQGEHRFAFEFRDPSWFDERAYEMLCEHNAAFCIHEIGGQRSPRETTADWVYVRLHGPGKAYEGDYDSQALSGWTGAFSTWLRRGKDVYCYFDNDQAGYAVKNAQELEAMAGGDE